MAKEEGGKKERPSPLGGTGNKRAVLQEKKKKNCRLQRSWRAEKSFDVTRSQGKKKKKKGRSLLAPRGRKGKRKPRAWEPLSDIEDKKRKEKRDAGVMTEKRGGGNQGSCSIVGKE